MSALPDKCRELHDLDAYKIVNQRLVGQWIKISFNYPKPERTFTGKVTLVVQGRSTKTINIIGKLGRLEYTLHDLCAMTIKRYRNEQHFKSENK